MNQENEKQLDQAVLEKAKKFYSYHRNYFVKCKERYASMQSNVDEFDKGAISAITLIMLIYERERRLR